MPRLYVLPADKPLVRPAARLGGAPASEEELRRIRRRLLEYILKNHQQREARLRGGLIGAPEGESWLDRVRRFEA